MRKEIAEQWVQALRSGQYKQTTTRLKNAEGGCCCLGVLCTLAPKSVGEFNDLSFEWVETVVEDNDGEYPCEPHEVRRDHYEDSELPTPVMTWAGVSDSCGTIGNEFFRGRDGKEYQSLAELNDSGMSFAEIADIIENNWKAL